MRIRLENLKVGDIFYECYGGVNYKMEVTTLPEYAKSDFDGKRQWSWYAKDTKGNIIDYLITEGFEHYGPKIYSIPMYGKLENGEIMVEVR